MKKRKHFKSIKDYIRYANTKRKKSRYRKNPEGSDHHAAVELEAFIVNNRLLYQNQARYIMVNLAKKMKRGVYDEKKAVKLWGYLADAGAQKYTRDHDTPSRANGSYGIFSPATRRVVARELQLNYEGETKDLYRALKAGKKIAP